MAVRLERLKIHKFRDVVPGTELRFSHGWNVVLGRNATGKTTLLHLISMALRGDFTALRGEEFDVEYELSNGEATLQMGVRNEHPGERDTRKVWGQFAWGDGAFGDPSVGTHLVALRAALTAGSNTESFASPNALKTPRPGAPAQPLDLPPSRLELAVPLWLSRAKASSASSRFVFAATAYRFDEGIELLRNVRGIESEAVGLPGVAGAVFQNPNAVIRVLPVALPEADWSADQPADATTWHVTFARCPNLAKVAVQLDGASLVATYPITSNELVSEGRMTRLGPPTILLRRQDGSSVSIDQLSFGQKRLFTFAWYLDANPDVVVADELVNGMHYEWIEDCTRAMEGRQVFVTAQNPLLLDHVGVSSSEDVTRSFVLCGATRTDATHREVRWTHPSAEQAAEFFRAYENGVLRVHEILRTEGLW